MYKNEHCTCELHVKRFQTNKEIQNKIQIRRNLFLHLDTQGRLGVREFKGSIPEINKCHCC